MKPNATVILASIALVISCFCIAMMQGAEAARDGATSRSLPDAPITTVTDKT